MVRAATARTSRDAGSSSLETAVAMIGVFLLIGLLLHTAVTMIAAHAAAAAAERGLQVAQTPGSSEVEARDVIASLTSSSGFVSATAPDVRRGTEIVTVTVSVTTVLGNTVSRTVTGPRLRFVGQGDGE
jgi:hypothetical protein